MSIIAIHCYDIHLKNGAVVACHARSVKRDEPVNGVPCAVFEPYPGLASTVERVPESEVVLIRHRAEHCTPREIARIEGDPNWIAMVGGDTEQKVSFAEARINDKIAKALERLEAIEARIEGHAKTIDDAAAYCVASRKDALAAAESIAELLRETIEAKAAEAAADAGMTRR